MIKVETSARRKRRGPKRRGRVGARSDPRARLTRLVARAEAASEASVRIKALKLAIALSDAIGRNEREPLLRGALLTRLGEELLAIADTKPAGVRLARIDQAAALLQQAVLAFRGKKAKRERAQAQVALANALRSRSDGASRAVIEAALGLYARALGGIDRNTNRDLWAEAMLNLANCYADRGVGSRSRNIDEAIALYDAALRVYDRSASPEDWARAQMNRAMVLAERTHRDRRRDQEAAIAGVLEALKVRTRRRRPRDWATCHSNLGALYYERISGERADNLELAIAAAKRALTVRTRRADSEGWAASMGNLALAYVDRVRGDRAENIERGLDSMRAVLTVRTRRRSPVAWAKTKTTIALIYQERVKGARPRNLEAAIAAGEAALTALDPHTNPSEWAHAQAVTANAYGDRVLGDRAQNIEKSIAMLEAITEVVDARAAPVDWATAHLNLATAYLDRIEGRRSENLERAIAHSEAALRVFTQASAPMDWASINANLAGAYFHRASGDRRENLERSIAAGTAALLIFTPKSHPVDCAMAKINLANALRDRISGDRAENHARALRQVRSALRLVTAERAPDEWASANMVLASLLVHSVSGSQRSNVENGVKAIVRAMGVYTRDAAPLEWAQAQGTLSSLLLNRVDGARADNVELALNACSAALTVLTPANAPMHWAAAQIDLGICYFDRVRGDHAGNLEHAIAALQKALEVYSRRETPLQWAQTQGNLANAYTMRVHGDRIENARRAVAAMRSVLGVYTKQRAPYEWALGQMNIAIALQQLPASDGGGLSASIRSLERALSVLTTRDHPLDWAMTHTNLGNAWRWRAEATGEASYRRRAALHYRRALQVFTLARFPEQHLRVTRLLGLTELLLRRWRLADRAFEKARAAADIALGVGVHDAERGRLLKEVARLGPQAAFARLKCGDPLAALQILDAGRARELMLAMRFDDDAIPAAQRRSARVVRQELRAIEETLAASDARGRTRSLRRMAVLQNRLRALADTMVRTPAGFSVTLADLLSAGAVLVAPVVTEAGSAAIAARVVGGSLECQGAELDLISQTLAAPALEAPAQGAQRAGQQMNVASAPEAEAQATAVFGAAVARTGVKHAAEIVFLAPGDAAALSPSLARDPRNGRYLIEDYVVSLAPSVAVAVKARRSARIPRALKLGAIVDPVRDLPATVLELGFGARQFDEAVAAVVGAEASIERARELLQGCSHWLFATHGRFDPGDARRSELTLADGALTMTRLRAFVVRKPPRLVVLSACESGLHERRERPEEFTGFANLFQELGASGVVSAAWRVDDVATAFLIGEFFAAHIGRGLAPAAALRCAQLWLRDATAKALRAAARVHGDGEEPGYMTAARRRVQLSLAALAPDERPFAAPEHWAAFSLTGV